MEHPFEQFASSYGAIKAVTTDGSGTFYLGASTQNFVSLVTSSGDATSCMWMYDQKGQLWLSASLTVYRYLGWADQDYADWGVGAGPPYSQPLIYHSDGTVSMQNQPVQKLYKSNGWACWGAGKGGDVLKLTPAPPEPPK